MRTNVQWTAAHPTAALGVTVYFVQVAVPARAAEACAQKGRVPINAQTLIVDKLAMV